ncbi:compactin diketide synthase mokB [Aspergillus udagawae]|nr:compactin diketide synthase mokB [Aspergillus udagawae]
MTGQRWQEQIAIVSMACRLPGGIEHPLDLWSLVREGRSTETEVPGDRFAKDSFLTMDHARRGEVAVTHGHFLQRDLGDFDHRFFGITKEAADAMDPQHKQLLEVVYECFEAGGMPLESIRGGKIGCFCGQYTSDYHDIQMRDPDNLPTYMALGTTRSMLANQISQAFDLRGPSIAYDTACSTSIVALHAACQAIHLGDCDSAIVGATNLFLGPEMALAMDRFGTLATDGRTLTFDANAHGYGRAEAINAIYIKKLSDALKSGDHVRAVIRSTYTNADGGTTAMTVPSSTAQTECIRSAYEQAGIADLNDTGYFECHGTATPTGDPIEVAAVSEVFAPTRMAGDPLWVGSTKTNVGHSEAASGLSSIIKVAMALEAGLIPPVANFKNPNPRIDFDNGRVRVPTTLGVWPQKSVKRASINSFGIGGSNAHVILDAFDSRSNHLSNTEEGKERSDRRPYLMFISAASRQSLQMNTSKLVEFLGKPDVGNYCLRDLAEVMNIRRSQLEHRQFISAYNITEAKESLKSLKSDGTSPVIKKQPRLLFVFTGQGAFWSQMGLSLMNSFSVAKDSLARLDRITQDLQVDNLCRELSEQEVLSPKLSQPLSTAVQIALVDLLSSWNVHPHIVVGHSSGEVAAAYAAGSLTAQEAMAVSYYRSIAVADAQPGAMLAVNCGPDYKQLQDKLQEHDVAISCFNSSSNLTLGGSYEGIDRISRDLGDLGVSCRRLAVSQAYHTAAMREAARSYRELLYGKLHPKEGHTTIYSAALGKRICGNELDADFWEMHLRSPVRFEQALSNIFQHEKNVDVILEVGPHRALSRPVIDTQALHIKERPSPYLSTMIRNTDTAINMMRLAGSLALNGAELDLRAVNMPGEQESGFVPRLCSSLPAYSWDYCSKSWSESRISKEWRMRNAPRHELLGSRVLGCDPLVPVWRNILRPEHAPWLLDHQVHGSAVFPMSAYLAMAIEAVMQVEEKNREVDWGTSHVQIEEFTVSRSIVLEDGCQVETILTLHPLHLWHNESDGWFQFTISSVTAGAAVSHSRGRARVVSSKLDYLADETHVTPGEYPVKVPVKQLYKALAAAGIHYGPSFHLLENARGRPHLRAATATVESHRYRSRPGSGGRYLIHPVTLDVILQTLFIAQCSGRYQSLTSLIAASVKALSVRRLNDSGLPVRCLAKVYPQALGRFTGKLQCSDEQGVILVTDDVQLVRNTSSTSANSSSLWLQQSWKPDIDAFLRCSRVPSGWAKGLQTSAQRVRHFEKLIRLLSRKVICAGLPQDEDTPSHMRSFCEWLQFQAEAVNVTEPADEDPSTDAATDFVSRTGLAQYPDVQLAFRLANNMRLIFEGKEEPLSVMTEGGLLDRIYETGLMVGNMNEKIRLAGSLLCYKYPKMNILEIGAGTGGATMSLLSGLSSADGRLNCQSYTFTDISSGFFENARRKFGHFDVIEFKTLDIEKDPISQGFSEKYDLILAANVLHATVDIETTMRHVRSLLRDGGRLLLAELDEKLFAAGFLMGCLPGWWRRPRGSRTANAGLSRGEWDALMGKSGFSEISEVPNANQDSKDDLAYTRVMSARAVPTGPTVPLSHPISIRIVYRNDTSALQERLAQYFRDIGESNVQTNVLGGTFSPPLMDEWVVILDPARSGCLGHPSKVIWVTKQSQLSPVNPTGGLVPGFARTVRGENNRLHLITLDFDSSDPALMAQTVQGIIKRQEADTTELDLAEKEGQLYLSRLEVNPNLEKRFGPSRQKQLPFASLLKDTYVVSLKVPGLFESFFFTRKDATPIEDDEVTIEVKAVGLNSRDGRIARGQEPFQSFGMECAGIVRHCGPGSGFRPQDRVLALGKGTLCTLYRTKSSCCKKIPDWLSFERAACIPFAFCTAWYALVEVAHLRSSDRVLVCGATDVGMAAIQLATIFGAEVVAAIGNEKERSLVQSLGVSCRNVRHFDEFDPELLSQTRTKFQTIIDTTTYQHQSYIKAVNTGGSYLKVGRPVGTEVTLPRASNIKTAIVGLEQIYSEDQRYTGRILDQIMARIVDEEINLPMPKMSPLERIGESFSLLPEDESVKHAVTFEPLNMDCLVQVATEKPRFNPEAAYLIVGGLGGLGRAIAVWMASCGARNLLLMTRRASHAVESIDLLELLRAYSCKALITVGDVAESTDVGRVDRAFWNMNVDDLNYVLNTRVKGCYNLHNAFRDTKLDFFVTLGSACGIFGNPGQCNYAASNTFLDAFARYRRRLGLAASTIDLGIVDEIGYVSRNPHIQAGFLASGFRPLAEREVLEAIEAAISTECSVSPDEFDDYSSSQIIRGVDWTTASKKLAEVVAKDARFRTPLRKTENNDTVAREAGHSESAIATAKLRDTINKAKDTAEFDVEILQRCLYDAFAARLADVLSIDAMDVQPSRLMAEYGLDSLTAVQIRSWTQSVASVDTPVNDLMGPYTVRELVSRITNMIIEAGRAEV